MPTKKKKLVVVESPSKEKTIKKYLGDDYEVTSSVGHVRDLPKSNKNAVDVDEGFTPHYVIPDKKKDVVKKLRKLAKKADEVILATDPDREGEAIAWHVFKVLSEPENSKSKIPSSKFKRVTFNEITKEAVLEAMEHPREIDDDLRHAQEARRVLDRLVGYDLSGLIWKKVRYGLSAGRVQSPALRIIMEREREIREFEPEDYWVITADVNKQDAKKGDAFELTCDEEPRDEDLVDTIVETAESATWEITEIDEQKRKRNPRAPFKTSTLQRSASTRLGFSPARTMRAAQKLYEAGLITYMRTDSTRIASSAQKQIIAHVKDEYGEKYLKPRQFKTKSKGAQEAHEGIRPTSIAKKKAGRSKDQKRLYDLIWRRSVASQMSPAKLLRTKVTATISDDEDIPTFSISGTRTLFDGWLKVMPFARGEDAELPELEEGEVIDLLEVKTEAKQTSPPNRYSEAGLVKELEKRGIGRPSTYASIMNTLEKRGYVNKDGKTLHPTDTGDVVSSFLEEHFTQYVDDDFTSEMEDKLDDIAEGKEEYEELLEEFYGPFQKQLESKKDIEKLTHLGPAPDEYDCPECGADMVIKLGKAGKFMSCSKFPDCKGARTIEGEELTDEPIGEHPDTGQDIYVKNGPYGPYVQLGEDEQEDENGKKQKPRRAGIPDDIEPDDVTVKQATKWLSLPRTLGEHPDTGNEIQANIGRYGPYVAHMKDGKPDYRSLKKEEGLNPYDITLEEALEIFEKPKYKKKGKKKKSKKKDKGKK